MGISSMREAERKLVVCLKKKCSRCELQCKVVPDDCEYTILHLLEIQSGGFVQRARRSGKTTEALECARMVVEAGYGVIFMAQTYRMLEDAREQLRHDASYESIKWVFLGDMNRVLGLPCHYLVTDEVKPKEIGDLFHRHIHILGLYT